MSSSHVVHKALHGKMHHQHTPPLPASTHTKPVTPPAASSAQNTRNRAHTATQMHSSNTALLQGHNTSYTGEIFSRDDLSPRMHFQPTWPVLPVVQAERQPHANCNNTNSNKHRQDSDARQVRNARCAQVQPATMHGQVIINSNHPPRATKSIQ